MTIMFLNFDIATDWKYILLGVGILIAVIIIIVLLKKHFKTMIFLVFLIGFAYLFYWANSKFAFSFTQTMACKEIERGFDDTDYNFKEYNNYTFYYRKTEEDGKQISDSSDCFVVRKFLFTYFESSPEVEGQQASSTFFVSYKYYSVGKVKDKDVYVLQINAKSTLTGELAYFIPNVTAKAADGTDIPLTKVENSAYTYTTDKMPDSLTLSYGLLNETFETKEGK